MKKNMLPIENRLRALASVAVAITLFVLPAGAAFARGGHSGGGHGGFHAGAAHASVGRSGFGSGGMRAGGISRGGFARGQFANSGRHNFAARRGVRSFQGSSGRQFALRNSQRFGNVRGRNGVFFNGNRNFYGYPYGYGSYYGGYGYRSYYGGYGYGSYYYNVCNPYSVYYDPYYCQQLYYGGY